MRLGPVKLAVIVSALVLGAVDYGICGAEATDSLESLRMTMRQAASAGQSRIDSTAVVNMRADRRRPGLGHREIEQMSAQMASDDGASDTQSDIASRIVAADERASSCSQLFAFAYWPAFLLADWSECTTDSLHQGQVALDGSMYVFRDAAGEKRGVVEVIWPWKQIVVRKRGGLVDGRFYGAIRPAAAAGWARVDNSQPCRPKVISEVVRSGSDDLTSYSVVSGACESTSPKPLPQATVEYVFSATDPRRVYSERELLNGRLINQMECKDFRPVGGFQDYPGITSLVRSLDPLGRREGAKYECWTVIDEIAWDQKGLVPRFLTSGNNFPAVLSGLVREGFSVECSDPSILPADIRQALGL